VLIGIIREVSESLPHCELTFLDRCQIDVVKARAQHAAFRDALSKLNIRLILLEAQNHLPDAVFVEDCALVVDELAVIAKMGSSSRKPEIETLTSKLAQFRPLKFLNDPATLDGGNATGKDFSSVWLSGHSSSFDWVSAP
jgi:dimethylargininase